MEPISTLVLPAENTLPRPPGVESQLFAGKLKNVRGKVSNGTNLETYWWT